MNLKKQKGRYGGARLWVPIIAFAFLIPFGTMAQDCNTTEYLESQNIKAGESVTFEAGEIINQPGKQFVIDNGGSVVFKAGKRIVLDYGFKAAAGSILSATVAPCDPGGEDPEPSVVFPNPTDGILNVKASYKISALRLTDMSGVPQSVKTEIKDTMAALDLTPVKSGYYILEIIADKSVVESIRVERK